MFPLVLGWSMVEWVTFFRVEAVDETWDEVCWGLVLAGLVVGLEGVVDDLYCCG